MKLPSFTRRQAALAGAGLAVLLVLLAVLVTQLGGDDTTEDRAQRGRRDRSTTTASGRPDAPGPGGPAGEEAGTTTSTTTTTGPSSTPAPSAPAPAPSPSSPSPTSRPGRAATPSTTAPDAGGAPGAPRPADPTSPGTDESVGVDGGDPQSPPAQGPAGSQGPVRREPCAATGPPTIASPQTDGPSGDGGSWVTVGSLDGNCGGSSPSSFRTRGVDTRVVFRSDAEQLVVYLVDVDDPDSGAGFADVECRTRCAGSQGLQSRAGTYRIRVDATDGPWTVSVQEYRRG